jgi:hypothetical protein
VPYASHLLVVTRKALLFGKIYYLFLSTLFYHSDLDETSPFRKLLIPIIQLRMLEVLTGLRFGRI